MPRLTDGQIAVIKQNIEYMLNMRKYSLTDTTVHDTNQIYMDFINSDQVLLRVVLFLFPAEILLPIDKILNTLVKNWPHALLFVTSKLPTVGQIAKIPAGTELRLYSDFKINPFKGPYSAQSDTVVSFDDIRSVYYTSPDNMPTMLMTDPVAVWLGVKRGDIVVSSIPTKAVPYRIVYRCVR
jgi:hypothetical protein